MSNSVHISSQTTILLFHSGVCLCVCVCLATGFLTLQVQLPVLRPHLRWGITAYYSSTNSLSTHQPAGRQTPAAAEGVRGVALAPGCANSRLLTFYRWLIHYLDNSSPPARCPQLFSLSFRPCLSLCLPFFVCLSFSGVLYSFLNLFFSISHFLFCGNTACLSLSLCVVSFFDSWYFHQKMLLKMSPFSWLVVTAWNFAW